MKIEQKYCDLAIQLAKSSEHNRTRVGAVLVSGRQILFTGINRYKSNPLQKYYNESCKDFGIHLNHNIHAETDCIIQYKRTRLIIPKLKIYIARINKDDTIANGFCCKSCEKMLADFCIHDIIFSTETEEFKYKRLEV